MKKEGLILLALVLVFGFVVLGCGSTSEIPIKEDPEPTVTLKALKYAQNESWSGFDLLDSEFSFAAGDEIIAFGVISAYGSGGEFVLNDEPGGWGDPAQLELPDDLLNSDGLFFIHWELEAANISNIAGAGTQGIRVQGNNNGASTFVCLFFELSIIRGGVEIFSLFEEIADIEEGGIGIASITGFANAGTSTFSVVDYTVTESKLEEWEELLEGLF